MDNAKNLKLYYSIREVAEMLQIPEYTLRFWEKEFDALKPKKASSKSRQYTEKDIEMVRLIHHLVKVQGLTIKAANARLKVSKQRVVDHQQILERLKKVRAELVEIRDRLNDIVPADL